MYLVNVARGSVIDTEALLHALDTGLIAGAALDVFDREPDVPIELHSARNILLTPHVGGVECRTHDGKCRRSGGERPLLSRVRLPSWQESA